MKGKKREKKNKFKDGAIGPWFESWREPPRLFFDPSLSEEKESCPVRVNCTQKKKKKKKKIPIFQEKKLILCYEWCHILKLTQTASIIGRGNKKKWLCTSRHLGNPYFAT